MARSVGEAAATGLQAGLGLALQLNNQRDAKIDRERRRAIEDEDRTRRLQRDEATTSLQALTSQKAMLGSEVQAAEAAGVSLSPERQLAIAEGTKAVNAGISKAYATMGGADLSALDKKYTDAVEQVKAGKIDMAALSGPEFGAIFTQATGHSPKMYLRGPGGEPSPIEQAGIMVQQGMDGDDPDKAIQGLNILLKPKIQRVAGKPSPHGGTIIGAEIASLHLDPNSPKDDPHVVPMLKVYVNDPSESGPRMENGATGWYMAPLTKGRETGKDAQVESLSVKGGFDFMGQNMMLAEQLNQPEARAKVEEAYSQPGMTPEDWLNVRAQLGVRAPEKKVSMNVIPAGGRLATTVSDKQGNPVTTYTDGPPKRERAPTLIEKAEQLADERGTSFDEEYTKLKAIGGAGTAKIETGLAEVDKAEQAGRITPRQAEIERRAIRSGIKPGKYTGGDGTGGGGGGGGGSGGKSLKEREQERKELKDKNDRERAQLKDRFERADKAADNAENAVRSFNAEYRDGPPSKTNKVAYEAYQQERADLLARAKTARKRADDMAAELDKPPPSDTPAAPAAPAAMAGKGKLTKDAAASKFGF